MPCSLLLLRIVGSSYDIKKQGPSKRDYVTRAVQQMEHTINLL
ncbi:Uncharacterized protein APZ42_007668 [Daphnia magna]|uniref:Uncharacterized protein n=1 Tax=Daphnia magna TaxID=35525 RepID=A0A162BU05_9CRUS|nr:Uncharacterized protein APZ42_007668 [Daphnia magna]